MKKALFADPQALDDGAVPFHIFHFQIVEKMAPLPHQLQQPPAGMVVFDMSLKMLGEIRDPLA
jgi:hypothetical protein